MTVLLAATALLLALAVAVVLSPISVALDVTGNAATSQLDSRVRVRWLGLKIPIGPSGRSPRSRGTQRCHRSVLAPIRAMLCSPGFLQRCARLIVELAERARPKRLEFTARLGFDDPAETGALLGWMHSKAVRRDWCYLHIVPDFTTEVLEGRLHVFWKRSAASLVWPAIKFVASPVFWRAFRRYRAVQNSR